MENKKPFKLYPYQEELLNDFKNNRFLMVKHSRQVGLTTLIAIYIANFLLENKEKDNTILLFSGSMDSSSNILNLVREIIGKNKKKITYLDNNQRSIRLENDNMVRIGQTLDSFRGRNFNGIIMDNCFGVNGIEQKIDWVSKIINIKHFILVSSGLGSYTHFNKLFNDETNVFKKKTISWNLNPNFNIEWFESMKKLLTPEEFDIEIQLIDNIITPIKKDRVISVRLTDDLINKMSCKLLEKDINQSEYIRGLIEGDL